MFQTTDLSILTPRDSSMYFPLRSNVHYFDSEAGRLDLGNRVRQAAVLYEELRFEGGVYIATFWEGHASSQMYLPPQDVSAEDLLADDAVFRPSGSDAFMAIDGLTFASGKAKRSFRCHYHGLLHQSGIDAQDWIKVGTPYPSPVIDSKAKELARDDSPLLETLAPDVATNVGETLLTNLNRDLMQAANMDVPASLDNFFEPLLRSKAERSELRKRSGMIALGVAVPNWSGLHWDQILEVREEPSIKEFRQRMVNVERVALERMSENSDTRDLEFEIAQIFKDELLVEIRRREKTQGDVARDVLIDIATSPVPGLSSIFTTARGKYELAEQEAAWTATFYKLKGI